MTIQGTVNKTALSLLILMATASYTWNLGVGDSRIPAFTMVGLLGGFVLAMVTVFKKEWAGTTTPMYAALEGLALGGISAMFEARYPGPREPSRLPHLRHARRRCCSRIARA